MLLQQISIFLENKAGRLAEVTALLGKAGVNMRALTLADTADYGILRLIVNNNDLAEKVLKENGFTVGKTDVVAVEVPDRPGGLSDVLSLLGREGINVEYLYAFVEKSGDGNNAMVIFRFDDPSRAVEVLGKNGIRVVPSDQVYNL